MSMVCPRCQRTFEQQVLCRECGCRLQFQAQNLEGTPMPATPTHFSDHWQHTPWGKIVAGLLLAVGLSFGLQQLCTAGLLVGGDSSGAELWGTLWGLVLLQLLQGMALLVGGAA